METRVKQFRSAVERYFGGRPCRGARYPQELQQGMGLSSSIVQGDTRAAGAGLREANRGSSEPLGEAPVSA